MARTIKEIQQTIIDAKNAESALAGLTSTSSVAMWRLWAYIVAVCMWTLENLFDLHQQEMEELLAVQKPHTLKWYTTRAKQFQYGVALPEDSDLYPAGSTDPAVAIISHAAAVELINLVRIKVARQGTTGLERLSTAELTAFTSYMNRIKDAGVRLQITSDDPDELRLELWVHYDPLVLTGSGARLDGSAASPVKDAIKAFLADLPFNGVFVLNNLIIALQGVSGVRIGEVRNAEAHYASTSYVPAMRDYTPDSGYMALDEAYFDTHVQYLPY